MPEIRVLLADDQQLMREGLRVLLDMTPDIRVVGEAGDGYGGERAQELGLGDFYPVGSRPVNFKLSDGLAGQRMHEGAADHRYHAHQALGGIVHLEHVHELGQRAAELLQGLLGGTSVHRPAASLRRRLSRASARLFEQPQ